MFSPNTKLNQYINKKLCDNNGLSPSSNVNKMNKSKKSNDSNDSENNNDSGESNIINNKENKYDLNLKYTMNNLVESNSKRLNKVKDKFDNNNNYNNINMNKCKSFNPLYNAHHNSKHNKKIPSNFYLFNSKQMIKNNSISINDVLFIKNLVKYPIVIEIFSDNIFLFDLLEQLIETDEILIKFDYKKFLTNSKDAFLQFSELFSCLILTYTQDNSTIFESLLNNVISKTLIKDFNDVLFQNMNLNLNINNSNGNTSNNSKDYNDSKENLNSSNKIKNPYYNPMEGNDLNRSNLSNNDKNNNSSTSNISDSNNNSSFNNTKFTNEVNSVEIIYLYLFFINDIILIYNSKKGDFIEDIFINKLNFRYTDHSIEKALLLDNGSILMKNLNNEKQTKIKNENDDISNKRISKENKDKEFRFNSVNQLINLINCKNKDNNENTLSDNNDNKDKRVNNKNEDNNINTSNQFLLNNTFNNKENISVNSIMDSSSAALKGMIKHSKNKSAATKMLYKDNNLNDFKYLGNEHIAESLKLLNKQDINKNYCNINDNFNNTSFYKDQSNINSNRQSSKIDNSNNYLNKSSNRNSTSNKNSKRNSINNDNNSVKVARFSSNITKSIESNNINNDNNNEYSNLKDISIESSNYNDEYYKISKYLNNAASNNKNIINNSVINEVEDDYQSDVNIQESRYRDRIYSHNSNKNKLIPKESITLKNDNESHFKNNNNTKTFFSLKHTNNIDNKNSGIRNASFLSKKSKLSKQSSISEKSQDNKDSIKTEKSILYRNMPLNNSGNDKQIFIGSNSVKDENNNYFSDENSKRKDSSDDTINLYNKDYYKKKDSGNKQNKINKDYNNNNQRKTLIKDDLINNIDESSLNQINKIFASVNKQINETKRVNKSNSITYKSNINNVKSIFRKSNNYESNKTLTSNNTISISSHNKRFNSKNKNKSKSNNKNATNKNLSLTKNNDIVIKRRNTLNVETFLNFVRKTSANNTNKANITNNAPSSQTLKHINKTNSKSQKNQISNHTSHQENKTRNYNKDEDSEENYDKNDQEEKDLNESDINNPFSDLESEFNSETSIDTDLKWNNFKKHTSMINSTENNLNLKHERRTIIKHKKNNNSISSLKNLNDIINSNLNNSFSNLSNLRNNKELTSNSIIANKLNNSNANINSNSSIKYNKRGSSQKYPSNKIINSNNANTNTNNDINLNSNQNSPNFIRLKRRKPLYTTSSNNNFFSDLSKPSYMQSSKKNKTLNIDLFYYYLFLGILSKKENSLKKYFKEIKAIEDDFFFHKEEKHSLIRAIIFLDERISSLKYKIENKVKLFNEDLVNHEILSFANSNCSAFIDSKGLMINLEVLMNHVSSKCEELRYLVSKIYGILETLKSVYRSSLARKELNNNTAFNKLMLVLTLKSTVYSLYSILANFFGMNIANPASNYSGLTPFFAIIVVSFFIISLQIIIMLKSKFYNFKNRDCLVRDESVKESAKDIFKELMKNENDNK